VELYSRKMSSIPVSIGTSMALESIFIGTHPPYDPERKIPQKIILSNYQECWFNVETLIRNISSSVERSQYLDCKPQHILEILLGEIEIINSIFQIEGNGICKPVFYFCTYQSLLGRNVVELRKSTTVIQKSYDLKADTVIKQLNRQSDTIFKFDSDLRGSHRPSILILTHYPYDLTSHGHFRKMDLLESHTGLLKSKHQWNTKYAEFGQLSLRHLPFHREILLIFGDHHQVAPQSRKIRQMVYDISIQYKWSPFTTLERIRESYRSSITHPLDLQYILSF